MDVAGYIVTIFIAYLLGSIPTGFLVAKARGVDIRSVGSGNIGATNVMRILGKPAGTLVLAVDALKGWVAVALLPRLIFRVFQISPELHEREFFEIAAGFAVVLGHNYTCWLKFKGGKGIATSAGVLIGLVPQALLVIFCIWVVVFVLTRYVSLASICASFALPFSTWVLYRSITMTAVTGIMATMAIYKHRANIRRLLSGTESRLKFREAGR